MLTYNDQENPNDSLEEERNGDESSQDSIILEGRPLFQHCLQLRSVGHEERHIQHALSHAFLGGVMIDVDDVFQPGARNGWLEEEKEKGHGTSEKEISLRT